MATDYEAEVVEQDLYEGGMMELPPMTGKIKAGAALQQNIKEILDEPTFDGIDDHAIEIEKRIALMVDDVISVRTELRDLYKENGHESAVIGETDTINKYRKIKEILR